MNEHSRIWSLQEAKAKFSEVVRRAQTEGPQVVTVHGKEAVVITSAEVDLARANPQLTGADLWHALSAGPPLDFDLPDRSFGDKSREFSFDDE
jgi:prevent-host-death family protein